MSSKPPSNNLIAAVAIQPEPYRLLTCHPKPLLPLRTPPHTTDLPDLPSPPRKSLLDPWFTLSTHLIPAAFTRTAPDVAAPPSPDKWSNVKKDTRKAYAKQILDLKARYWKGELDDLPPSQRPLWICINRYTRKRAHPERKGVTLFFVHAISMHKEAWEPVLQRLLSEYNAGADYQIDEIWLWEAANHGDSCLINIDKLGGLYDWKDNTRDILHFLLHYLPSSVSSEVLPTHLLRLSDVEAERRKAHGFPERDMLFVGHSFGGCSILRVAIEHPAMFKSLVLFDPVVLEGTGKVDFYFMGSFVALALQRRSDSWPSREAALRELAASPFFQPWDPAVLAIYVECALYETGTGEVRLKMPLVQEAVGFAEQLMPYEVFELLPTLDERVELRWVFSGKDQSARVLPDEWIYNLRRKQVWRRPANFSYAFWTQCGHLIPQEAPAEVALELHEHLNKRYRSQKARL